MKAVIFWAKSEGLANRLRALVGYQALSCCLEAPFYLCWESNWACNTDFANLFDTSGLELISKEQMSIMKKQQEAIVYSDTSWFDIIWRKHLNLSISWKLFKNNVFSYTNRLSPHSHIIRKVDTFTNQNSLHCAKGIHIRLTDNISAYKNELNNPDFHHKYISQLSGFERYIEDSLTTNQSIRIFLATDNKDIEKYLQQKYDDQIITFPKQYKRNYWMPVLSRQDFKLKRRYLQRTSSVEEALIEMLILANCQTIVGTYWSSFSKFAAYYGDKSYYDVRGSKYYKINFLEEIQGTKLDKV